MSLVKFNSFNRFPRITKTFDNFFNDDLDFFTGRDFISSTPSVNIKENEDGYTVELAAPGLLKEDFKVNVEKDLLTISAEVKTESEEKTDKYTRKEFAYGSFKRTFTLPNTVESDKIDAKYENGVLNVVIPKKEEAKPKPARAIEIS